MGTFFSFPNPVNEVSARVVAAGVFLISVATVLLSTLLSTDFLWLTAVLVLGFAARVATGPKLSVLGQLATKVIAPRIGHEKLVAGPPKRFAQGMGFTMALLALLLFLLGAETGAIVVVGLIVVASFLESALAFCIGCQVFGLLIRVGVIPEQVCVECATWGFRASRDGRPAHSA